MNEDASQAMLEGSEDASQALSGDNIDPNPGPNEMLDDDGGELERMWAEKEKQQKEKKEKKELIRIIELAKAKAKAKRQTSLVGIFCKTGACGGEEEEKKKEKKEKKVKKEKETSGTCFLIEYWSDQHQLLLLL